MFAAISPWNFPVAIFTGQIAGALAAGNAVVAKPAERTSLIAYAATRLLHEAGVPGDVLHLLPGDGRVVGSGDGHAIRATAGVVFTGGTDTAHMINRMLAERDGPIVAVHRGDRRAQRDDRGFDGAARAAGQGRGDVGVRQRGTALLGAARSVRAERHRDARVKLIKGAMAELKIGDPMKLDTDIGPVIDARRARRTRGARQAHEARGAVHRRGAALRTRRKDGFFFAPRAFEIDAIAQLEREVFGPILHVVRYEATSSTRCATRSTRRATA